MPRPVPRQCDNPAAIGEDPTIDLVVFDLGGVLMELSGVAEMGRLTGIHSEETGIHSEEQIWARWLSCEWVRRFERGRCSIEEFSSGIVADWGLDTDAEAFTENFSSWLVGPFPGATELVRQVGSRCTTACLSNSNEAHWRRLSRWGVLTWFDHLFFSHEMDRIKPDRDAFEHVVAATGCPADRILFLDDNRMNVEAAQAVGWRAERVPGVAEARQALVEHGLLDRP